MTNYVCVLDTFGFYMDEYRQFCLSIQPEKAIIAKNDVHLQNAPESIQCSVAERVLVYYSCVQASAKIFLWPLKLSRFLTNTLRLKK